ncbi:MAG: glycosyl transferase, partial [Muribaculaceae bacterium]|nr:glycosyl transferase [Muribaculaceae bacterium]
MKIAILSTSLTTGGAAIVTERLGRALENIGHEVKFFTLPGRRARKLPFLAERLEVFAGNGFNRKDLFK